MRIALLALLLGGAVAAGCSLFHDPYPDDSCETDFDCFSGRETCQAKKCVPISSLNRETAQAEDAGVPDAAVGEETP